MLTYSRSDWKAEYFDEPGIKQLNLAALVVRAESWWFDVANGVYTRATPEEESGRGNDPRAGFWYIPTRPSIIRRVLRAMPIGDHSQFTFVDFGSGKGRVLLAASRFRFLAVLGVEKDAGLHAMAAANVEKRGNGRIRLFNVDALDFEFPATALALYFFNPFGEEIFQQLLSRLEASLATQARPVVIALVYPEYAHVVRRFNRYRAVYESERFHIYQASAS